MLLLAMLVKSFSISLFSVVTVPLYVIDLRVISVITEARNKVSATKMNFVINGDDFSMIIWF
jgi:hypothetical protein